MGTGAVAVALKADRLGDTGAAIDDDFLDGAGLLGVKLAEPEVVADGRVGCSPPRWSCWPGTGG